MNRAGWIVAIVAGVSCYEAAAAKPPVVAPKPSPQAVVAGCPECRFLTRPSLATGILPVQAGPQLPLAEAMPGPLPHASDAKPLQESVGRSPLGDLVEQYLPNLSADEQRVWIDELKSLPPDMARDLLAARSRFSEPQPLPESLPEGHVPPPEQTEPIPSLDGLLRRVPPESPASRVGPLATLEALGQVEAALVHNIANADTIGYKRLRPLTTESPEKDGLQGVVIRRVDLSGPFEKTGSELDLAIEGPGLFQVRQADAIALTRRGTFRLTSERRLAIDLTGDEWSLYPPVDVPSEATAIVAFDDGRIGCRLAGHDDVVVVGQVELVRVADISHLESVGGGLFAVPESAEPVTVGRPGGEAFGRIRQGCLEGSNVVLSDEIAALKRVRRQIATLQDVPMPQLASPLDRHSAR